MLERYLNSEPTMTERLACIGRSNTGSNAAVSGEEEAKEREKESKEFVRMWQQSWEAKKMSKEG